jgi:hypothetical protein
MKLKRTLLLILQFVIFGLTFLPFLSTRMVTVKSDCERIYQQDIWYTITLLCVGLVFFTYFNFVMDKWHKLEDWIGKKYPEMVDFITDIQKWRRIIYIGLFVILALYALIIE